MNILIVGNVVKDVYLDLDSHTESLETDNNGTDWLNLSFDATEHHFKERTSNYGGAAISLEVLQKMGLPAMIADSDFHFEETGPAPTSTAENHRYILTSKHGTTYFTPSVAMPSTFTTPTTPVDYIFIDRSANLSESATDRINGYLNFSHDTKLILYVKDPTDTRFAGLIRHANLIFLEKPTPKPGSPEPPFRRSRSIFANFPEDRIITISESGLGYGPIHESLSISRINTLTHLSAYSIIAATILAGFILGKTVEYSLKMARVNVENSTLSSTLTYPDLEDLVLHASRDDLEQIANDLMASGKGILAADESGGSIEKKFAALGIADTFENRHAYRDIFFSTPHIEDSLSGVILFDETARDHAVDGQTYPDFLSIRGIIPGIKVDQGLAPLEGTTETYTKGLEDLPVRLREYYGMGLRFAKWRAAFHITLSSTGEILTPTDAAIQENCRRLAEYAKDCQVFGLVPIVEPEVVYDGDYPLDACAAASSVVLDNIFEALKAYGVNLRACILKTNMVMAGKQYFEPSTPDEVGRATAKILVEHVPAELAGIVFLSGGQTPEQATENLAAILKNGPFPWPITFSFARALQDPALYAWNGDNDNRLAASQAFLNRLQANIDVLRQ